MNGSGVERDEHCVVCRSQHQSTNGEYCTANSRELVVFLDLHVGVSQRAKYGADWGCIEILLTIMVLGRTRLFAIVMYGQPM
jgi:hypothetical protein